MILDGQSWLFWAQIAQGTGSILSVLVTLYIAIQLYRYTKRRDKLEFLRQRWHEQQQINIMVLSNPAYLEKREKIVYGENAKIDLDLAEKFYSLFLSINQIHHHYIAYQYSIYSHSEFKRFSLPTLKLICREYKTIDYLLAERGYSSEFRSEISNLIKEVEPATLPINL